MRARMLPGLFALVAWTAACQPAPPPAPPPVDPVGSFTFESTFQGQPITGTFVITEGTNGYRGSLSVAGLGSFPITGVTVAGQEMTLSVSAEGDPVDIVLVFTGDTFTGSWSSSTDGGSITGSRS